ncbi:MAG: DUF899 domain-containing protein [Fimbriimonas ginsengisoli]|uniref:DUF899 domain-containing protein n=1 Tax=Fimbriimonas ginsengisoli TaxID=1005039 RepID=A0A931LW83_FIMGI|nr:DUF899 domain-containing protein [Fimbriimonas ginsengisoli]
MSQDICIAHPPTASKEEWLAERTKLLAEEKALTKQYDRVNALRRRLPMVKVEKNYRFEGPTGEKSLLELFEGRTQLIVHHFMFDPLWEKGCPSCTFHANAFGDLSLLARLDTHMVRISRAPFERLESYRQEKGWTMAWYSSGKSDFNYDFGVTLDPARGLLEYNYKSVDDIKSVGGIKSSTELPGFSVLFRVGEEVFHTYSAYGRGVERLMDGLGLADITPYGRQEDFEDSPEGWPQNPTYG